MCNNIYGRVSKTILTALMAWNIGSRPIWLVRAGETDGPVRSSNYRNAKNQHLNERGRLLANALGKFITEKGAQWYEDRNRYLDEVDALTQHLQQKKNIGSEFDLEEEFGINLNDDEYDDIASHPHPHPHPQPQAFKEQPQIHNRQQRTVSKEGKDLRRFDSVILESGLAPDTPKKVKWKKEHYNRLSEGDDGKTTHRKSSVDARRSSDIYQQNSLRSDSTISNESGSSTDR